MSLRVGAVAPQAITVNVLPSSLLPDLREVVSAIMHVVRPLITPEGTRLWECQMGTPTEGGLVVTRPLQANDLPVAGTYRLVVVLTTATISVPTVPVTFVVLGEYEV